MSQVFVNILDPDVAGPGVFVGFILTGAITLLVSLVLSRLEVHILSSDTPKSRCIIRLARRLAPGNIHTPLEFWKKVLEKLVLGLSDQQLLTGLLLLPIALVKYWGRGDWGDLYYAADLAFFSSITHAATLLALQTYFRRYFWMTLIRLILTGITFILWAFVALYQAYQDLKPSYLMPLSLDAIPIVVGVFEVLEVAGLLWVYWNIVLPLYISEPALLARSATLPWKIRYPLLIFLFILGLALLAWDMQASGLQSSWGFGQLLPTFLVLLPFYQLAETYVEEKRQSE
ncbi:hypothetical protein BDZ45DRAFT_733250 [Acephala macrosclerotiorum]|nr:hypothetical protein BDZ45DRAFT_733250 [Acephala macrosclerotiorum]